MINFKRSIFTKEELINFFEEEKNDLLAAKRTAKDTLEKRPILAQLDYVEHILSQLNEEAAESVALVGRKERKDQKPPSSRPPRPARRRNQPDDGKPATRAEIAAERDLSISYHALAFVERPGY